jgi:hypothetical protein
MNGPYQIEDPVEIPGWGQIPGNTIDDDVTRARWELENCYPSLAMRWTPRLRSIVWQKTWRSAAVLDVLTKMERAFTAQLADVSKLLSQNSPTKWRLGHNLGHPPEAALRL